MHTKNCYLGSWAGPNECNGSQEGSTDTGSVLIVATTPLLPCLQVDSVVHHVKHGRTERRHYTGINYGEGGKTEMKGDAWQAWKRGRCHVEHRMWLVPRVGGGTLHTIAALNRRISRSDQRREDAGRLAAPAAVHPGTESSISFSCRLTGGDMA